MDLDSANNVVVLGFEYTLAYIDFVRMKNAYIEFKKAEESKLNDDKTYVIKGTNDFLKQRQADDFVLHRKSFEYDVVTCTVNEAVYLNLISEEISIKEIVNFKFISPRRGAFKIVASSLRSLFN